MYFHSLAARRRAGMGQLVRHLEQIGFLRPDMATDRGADIAFALFSHETYLALTRDAGWPIEQFKAWMWATLHTQLAGPAEPAPDAVQGLSFESFT